MAPEGPQGGGRGLFAGRPACPSSDGCMRRRALLAAQNGGPPGASLPASDGQDAPRPHPASRRRRIVRRAGGPEGWVGGGLHLPGHAGQGR